MVIRFQVESGARFKTLPLVGLYYAVLAGESRRHEDVLVPYYGPYYYGNPTGAQFHQPAII